MKTFLLSLLALSTLAFPGEASIFSYSRAITVDHTKISNADQANFPVYLVLSDSALKTVSNGGHVQSSSGADITFFRDQNLAHVLPYEIVSYNGSTGELTAVVLCPALSSSSDTAFYLAYGATSLTTSGANPGMVWQNYQGVYHLDDHSDDTSVLNSASAASQTGNGLSVNQTQALSTAGKLGAGLSFNGSTDYLDLGSFVAINNATALTYSGWIKFSALVDYEALIEKLDNPPGSGSVVSLSGSFSSSNSDWLAAVRNVSALSNYTTGYGITTGTWYYFAAVFQPNSVSFYVNGVQVSLSNFGGFLASVPSTVSHLQVGKESGHDPSLNGVMDEIRISTAAYSASWLATEYNNLNSPGTFASLGGEQQVASGLPPQSFPVQVVGITPTQAILRYKAPDNNACSIQVSDNPAKDPYSGTFQSVVHDVDPGLFAGADQDTRSGNFVNGVARTVIIGYRGVGDAIDGRAYSRALQAKTTHYFQIACGSGAFIGAGSFTTANVPLGNGAPDPIQYDTNRWGGWGWPTINYADMTPNYVDPQTGVLLKRWTSPGDEGVQQLNTPFVAAGDLVGTWQNPQNGLSGDGNYATYTGPGGQANALFLWGGLTFYRPSFTPVTFSVVDDLRIHINGFGDQAAAQDRTVSVCLSADYGQTCVGSPTDITLPQTNAADVSGPNPWPAPLFSGWGDAPITPDMLSNNFSGTLASISGNQVTWGANSGNGYNNYFPVTVLRPGSKILIAGTDPTCPKNICTIASIASETSLTIQQNFANWTPMFTALASAVSPGATSFTVNASNGFFPSLWGPYNLSVQDESISCTVLTGNTFSNCTALAHAHSAGAAAGEDQYLFPNFGFKLWKKTGIGTISIDSSSNDWAFSSNMYTDFQGSGAPYCSTNTVTAAYAANGVTPISPLPGYICMFNSMWGSQHLYYVAASTGEARKLSNLNNLSPSLDPDDPTKFYVFDNSNYSIQACRYDASDPVNGRFKRWDDGHNSTLNNPAISCTTLTSSGHDIATEIQDAYPQIDQSYFGPPTLQSSSYPLFEFMLRPGQGTLAWFCIVDVSQPAGGSQVIKCKNNWDTYPVRWLGSHGNEYFAGNGYTLMGAQGPLNSPGSKGIERWDLNIRQIYNNGGSTALSASFFDPQTCQQLGVTDSRWISQGATDHQCIKINVDNEPLAKSPASGDLVPLGTLPVGARPGPWLHNAASCGGDGTTANCWSYLQPMQEGDYLADPNSGDETFLLAKKTVMPDGSIDLVLARNRNPFSCRASNDPQTHAAGWTPVLWPPMTCTTGVYFNRITDPASATILDNPQTYLGHTVSWLNNEGNEVHATPYSWFFPGEMGGYGSGYGVRSGPFPAIIGQPFQFGVNDVYPFAGSNTGLSIGQIQSHPGGITFAAPARESNWVVDGRPLGGSGGGTSYLWNNDITKVNGTQSVYLLGLPLWSPGGDVINVAGWYATLDRKRRQVLAFAGYHLLKDISGLGSQISDATPWTYCIADFAGECMAGSAQGNQYVSVPTASASGICSNDGTISAPCLATAGPHAGAYTQLAVDQPDPFGLRWRKLTNMLGGPGRSDNYGNMHALATGDWGVSAVKWGDGRRTDVFGVKLPPWPTEDSTMRNTFVNVPVSLGGQAGSSVRIRFGYDANLFCSTRQEQCSTAVANSDPYAWLSEPQTWTPCDESTGCKVNIPAVSSRVLYYVVDRKSGAGVVTSGPVTVTVVK